MDPYAVTWDPSAAGIFADPQFLSPAKEKAIDSLATTFSNLFGAMAGVPLYEPCGYVDIERC